MGIIDSFAQLGILKILEKFGVGAAKNKTFQLSGANSVEEVVSALLVLAQEKNWPLQTNETIENKRVLGFQIGQWGFKFSGAQKAIVVIFNDNGKITVYIASKSIMGQIVDWGTNKKNIQTIAGFLEETFANPEKKSEVLTRTSAVLPITPRSSIHPLFYVLLAAIPIIFFVIRFLLITQPATENMKKGDLDTIRVTDKTAIATALMKYYFDNSEKYPEGLEKLLPQYLSSVPADPTTNIPYKYRQLDAGKDYELCIDYETLIEKSGCKNSLGFSPEFYNSEASNEQETTMKDEIADWIIYKNNEYGFEFSYPAAWGDVSDSPGSGPHRYTTSYGELEIEFLPSEFKSQYLATGYPFLTVRIRQNPQKVKAEDFYYALATEGLVNPPDNPVIAKNNGNIAYYEVITAGGEFMSIFPLDSAFVEFNHHTLPFKQFDLFNKIVATFKYAK